MPLVGKTFAKEPDLYRQIAEDPRTGVERRWLSELASLGEGLFEYYPELKPAEFGRDGGNFNRGDSAGARCESAGCSPSSRRRFFER